MYKRKLPINEVLSTKPNFQIDISIEIYDIRGKIQTNWFKGV